MIIPLIEMLELPKFQYLTTPHEQHDKILKVTP